MIKNPYTGKLIVFEGLDGSGQSTQVAILGEFLESKGYKVLKTKEPTKESQAGRKIRRALDKKERIFPLKLQKLFSQDRARHLKKTIIPALKKGKIVISDRYFFSSFSYGAADGLDEDDLLKLNNEFLLPDLVFFLKTPAAVCVKRIRKRGEKRTRFESEKKLEKVFKNYKNIFKKFKGLTKIYFINGERSINEIFEEIKKNVKKHCQNY